jgi:hypothetical protein
MAMNYIADVQYGQETDLGVSIPCVVTAINLSGEPMVSVKPMQSTRILGIDGEISDLPALEIDKVPYCFPSSSRFAVFVPPEIGMQGYLVVTDGEVGEAASGAQQTTRLKDRGSGFFLPSGTLNGKAFKGSTDWLEMRSSGCRVAMSNSVVHLQSGDTSLVLENGAFDIVADGISLVEALKELSRHVRQLETLVHPNGMTHGSAHSHLLDQLSAALVPSRAETGVR